MPEIREQRDGAILTLVIDNPAKRNAITREMFATLAARFAAADADPAVRVIVLTGEGKDAFCAGADIGGLQDGKSRADNVDLDMGGQLLLPLRCGKPVVAKVRGLAFGAGLLLAVASDFCITANDATFRMPLARLGLAPGYPPVALFASRLGPRRAADLFMSARKFTAAEAVQMGVALFAVAPEALDEEVARYCGMLAENAPLSLRAVKQTIIESLKDPAHRDLELLRELNRACLVSQDYEEGRTAFRERRQPQFKGA